MAFYASGLPNVAAATTDLWPSVANALAGPWQTSATSLPSPRQLLRRRAGKDASSASAPEDSVRTSTRTELPDFLRDFEPPQRSFAAAPSPSNPANIRISLAEMSQKSLLAANPLMQQSFARYTTQASRSRPRTSTVGMLRAIAQPLNHRSSMPLQSYLNNNNTVRFMSSLRQPNASRVLVAVFSCQAHSRAQRFPRVFAPQQYRGFGTGGISKNLLANREAAANRNPNSATSQLAFYQVLLKANMPHLVVERYQSGRYASNEATMEAYQRALGMISSNPGLATGDGQVPAGGITANNSQLSPMQLQAVGQALAAQTRGSTLAVAKGAQGTGAKDAPLHVVVDQPIGDVLFKWLKFILWFILVTYISLVVITMAIEGMNNFKRPGGGRNDTEVKAESQTTRFSDVHGCEEAKEELQDLVEFLKNPDRFSTLGGKLPKGVLLVGPPGTGKTLLARAVAGEAGVPFFYMSGSEFDEVYVGVGAKRVRDLFANAKSKSPSIVFIDELDAIGSRRNSRDAAYVKQTLNQLLTELDGFEQNSGVIILAATNFPELLDKALTRPGRFDRNVQVDLPDVRGRLAILKHHAKKVKMAAEVDLQNIAQGTSGLSGAELESIVNQAAIHASKAKSLAVTLKDFDWAKDKVIMGAERRSMVISPKEKEMTAYHEAGHALVSYYATAGKSSLYKVTILPRGHSLGHTAYVPEMDRYSFSARDYLAHIESCLGGKIAEELAYGPDMVTSGVSADLQQATNFAYNMVSQFGMSDKLGPMEYQRRYEHLSSETRAKIEMEVQRTLEDAYARARKLLTTRRGELDLLAKALVEYETLDKEEVSKVIKGEKLPDRTPVPLGPMLIPKSPKPLTGMDGGLTGSEGEGNEPPPPAPPPPGPRSNI